MKCTCGAASVGILPYQTWGHDRGCGVLTAVIALPASQEKLALPKTPRLFGNWQISFTSTGSAYVEFLSASKMQLWMCILNKGLSTLSSTKATRVISSWKEDLVADAIYADINMQLAAMDLKDLLDACYAMFSWMGW